MRQTTETFNDFKHAFIFQVNKFIKKGQRTYQQSWRTLMISLLKKTRKRREEKSLPRPTPMLLLKISSKQTSKILNKTNNVQLLLSIRAPSESVLFPLDINRL